jgi:hypothetical protein
MIATIQVLLFLGLALVALALEVWALVDAAGRRPEAFSYAGKRTRSFWLLLLGGATLAGFLALPPPLGLGIMPLMIMLGAVVPAGVYLADVRPAVRGYRRPPRRDGW